MVNSNHQRTVKLIQSPKSEETYLSYLYLIAVLVSLFSVLYFMSLCSLVIVQEPFCFLIGAKKKILEGLFPVYVCPPD